MKKSLLIIVLLLNFTMYAQEDKTVTLTVSGTGKTLEEAKTNALRSAIEQAFGAFISSKTEILNDNLVKDEVISVANGNVQKYDIVSQVELPKIGYAITLSATVSISKLTSFAESKGVIVEFKGGMFAQNIKLQKLNEQSEEKATKNLIEVYLQLLENSFDYSLVSSEPLLVAGQSDLYKINFNVKTIGNDNYNKFINYFKETLGKVQAIDEEATNIIKVGKPIYYLIIDEKLYKFRSINSFHNIEKFFITSQLLSSSFKINSNIGSYKYSFKQLFGWNFFTRLNKSFLKVRVVEGKEKNIYGHEGFLNNFSFDINEVKRRLDDSPGGILANLFPFYIANNTLYKSLSDLYKVQICPIPSQYGRLKNANYNDILVNNYTNKRKYFYTYNSPIDIDDTIYFSTDFNEISYSYDINLKLIELEKIKSFKIEKVPILKYINNLSSYVELEK